MKKSITEDKIDEEIEYAISHLRDELKQMVSSAKVIIKGLTDESSFPSPWKSLENSYHMAKYYSHALSTLDKLK